MNCEFCEIDGNGAHAPRCPVTLEAEVARLNALINNPHTNDFLEAVRTEAAHQRERWAADHDAGKADSDWFWLLGYLGGKALYSANAAAKEIIPELSSYNAKALHHIISTAAACLNWHAARTGASNAMRPDVDIGRHIDDNEVYD